MSIGMVAVCGFPTAGKTTVAQYLESKFHTLTFSKDAFAPALEAEIMSRLTGNPHDRDSQPYRETVGRNIYIALVQNALRLGRFHVSVTDAPMLELIHKAHENDTLLSEHLMSTCQPTACESLGAVPIKTIWISVDPDHVEKRMIGRGEPRDAPKLASWDAYRAKVLDSTLAKEAEKVVDIVLDDPFARSSTTVR